MAKDVLPRARLLPRITGRALVAGATALMIAAGLAGPALASTASLARWRISFTDRSVMSSYGEAAALSARNVWVIGGVFPAAAPSQPVIRRWNGRSWSAVGLPARYSHAQLTALAASSARNAWVFGQYRTSNGASPHTFALRWKGSSWTQTGLWLTYNTIDSATVISSQDVWVFGALGTLHYDGHGWTRFQLPFSITTASAVRSADIWATAFDNNTDTPVLARWNGSSWKTVPLPPITSPPPPSPGPTIVGVYARSDSDVWLVGSVPTATGSSQSLVLHWTAGRWQQFRLAGLDGLDAVVPDGTGGVWAAGDAPYCCAYSLLHYSAGRWHVVILPAVRGKTVSVNSLAEVPGSTTVYGAGRLFWGGYPATEGLIVKYS